MAKKTNIIKKIFGKKDKDTPKTTTTTTTTTIPSVLVRSTNPLSAFTSSSSQGTSGGGSSSSSQGTSGGGSSSGGGQSRVNVLTGKAEYVLPTGQIVPVTPETTKSITSGDSPLKTVLDVYKQTSTKDKTSTVKTIAEQQKLQNELDILKSQRLGSELLDSTYKSSSSSSSIPLSFPSSINLIDSRQKQIEGKLMSISTNVSQEDIEKLRGKKDLKTSEKYGTLKGGWKEFFTSPTITIEEANLAMNYIKNEEIAKRVAQDNLIKQREIFSSAEKKINDFVNSSTYKNKIDELQKRADRGENIDKINEELKRFNSNYINAVEKDMITEYNQFTDNYKNSTLKRYGLEAEKDLIKFNSRYGSKRFKEIKKDFVKSFKQGAVTGASLQAGGQIARLIKPLKSSAKFAGRLIGKVASAPVQAGLLGGIALTNLGTRGIREKQLQEEYGFSKKEAYNIARRESQQKLVNVGTGYVGFGAGAIASSKIISSGINLRTKAKINSEVNKFKKDFSKDVNLQSKYLTDKNIKKGFFTKEINGAKVKFTISKPMIKNYQATTEGTILVSQIKTAGVVESQKIKGLLVQNNVNVERSASISKINQATYTRLTGTKLNEREAYMLLVGSGNNRIGYIVRFTKTGGIKGNLQPVKVSYDPKTKKSIIQSGEIGKKISRSPFGDGDLNFIAEGQIVKNVKFFEGSGKIIKQSAQRRGESLITGTTGTTKISRIRPEVKFERGPSKKVFKKGELLSEFYQNRLIKPFTIPQKKPNIKVSEGLFGRISVKKPNSLLAKDGTREKFMESTRSLGIGTKPKIIAPKKIQEESILKLNIIPKKSTIKTKLSNSGPSIINIQKGQTPTQIDSGKSILLDLKTSIPKKSTVLREQIIQSTGAIMKQPKFRSTKAIKSTFEVPRVSSVKTSILRTSPLFAISKKSALASIPITSQKSLNLTRQALLLKPSQKMSQKLKSQEMRLSSISLLNEISPVTSNIKPPRIQPPEFSFGGFGAGKREDSLFDIRGRQRPKTKRKTTYTASLGSVLLKQKKKKVTKEELKSLGGKSYFGLELRPEIELV